MEYRNLYLWLNIAAISMPLILSFESKVRFYRKWPFLFPAIVVTAIFFITWDILFTRWGFWGFNDRYLTGIGAFGLPLCEFLFFFTVPYACVFIYEVLGAYFGNRLKGLDLRIFLWLIIAGAAAMNVFHPWLPYTLYATVMAAVVAGGLLYLKPDYTNQLIAAFLVSMIPFLFMNGILTGSWIPGEVVWYNPEAFSGWRILTIPVEDVFYSFGLISINIVLMSLFSNLWNKSRHRVAAPGIL